MAAVIEGTSVTKTISIFSVKDQGTQNEKFYRALRLIEIESQLKRLYKI